MNSEEAKEIIRKRGMCSCRQNLFAASTCKQNNCGDCDFYITDEELEEAEKILKNEHDIKEDPAMLKRRAFDKAMAEIDKQDNVNNPKHYAGSCSIECIDAMQMAYGSQVVHNFCICNAFKYLWRHKNKNGAEDLNKAEWYINKAEELTKIHTPIINDLRTILEKYREKFKSSNE